MAEMTWSDHPVRTMIVAAQSGQAAGVARGELVTVVDMDGHQVGDMWAIDATDPGRWLSTGHTRDRCERLFPAVGERFRDQHGEPILQLVADTSPGLHDMLFPPCDRWLYESRGLPGHPNCRDNFLAALSSAGISLPVVPARSTCSRTRARSPTAGCWSAPPRHARAMRSPSSPSETWSSSSPPARSTTRPLTTGTAARCASKSA